MKVGSRAPQLHSAATKAEKLAHNAQGAVETQRKGVKGFETKLESLKTSMTAELKKPQPDYLAVKAMRTEMGKVSTQLDTARAGLKASVGEATRATAAATAADVKAMKANSEVIARGEKVHADQFVASTKAKVLNSVGDGNHAVIDALKVAQKAIEKKIHDQDSTPAERSQAKVDLAAIRGSIKALKGSEKQMRHAAREASGEARQLARDARKLDPKVKTAKEALNHEVVALVGLGAGNINAAVKAAITESDLARNPVVDLSLVDHALANGNRDRSMSAYEKIDAVAGQSREAAGRLTPEIRSMLVKGVADARTSDVNGQEGVLGASQAETAARALAKMPTAQYEKVTQALSLAGSPTEQALILKAVAARADSFAGPTTAAGAGKLIDAQKEVLDFAREIRGMDRAKLIDAVTVIDVDASTSSSSVDPLKLLEAGKDTRTNNDGLFQHLTQSCAPTTGQMVRAEADPVFALSLTKAGLSNIDVASVVTKGQQDSLDAHSGKAIDRLTDQKVFGRRLEMIVNTKTQLGVTEQSPDPEIEAVWKLLHDQSLTPAEATLANEGLKKVRNANSGAPSDAEVTKMQELSKIQQRGTHAPTVISDLTEVATHARLTELDTKQGWYSPFAVALALPGVADRLRDGKDVPMGIGAADGKSGHVVLMTDVRGARGSEEFLISDPSSGRTDWVTKTELVGSNGWMSKFNLIHQQVTGFLE